MCSSRLRSRLRKYGSQAYTSGRVDTSGTFAVTDGRPTIGRCFGCTREAKRAREEHWDRPEVHAGCAGAKRMGGA